LAGLYCLTRGRAPERPRAGLAWVAGAGALAVLAALCKQVGVVVVIPFALWVTASWSARPWAASGWRRHAPLLAFAAGAALPALVVLARYAIAGELRTFFYYFVTYNSRVYLAPYDAQGAQQALKNTLVGHAGWILIAVVLVVCGLARALAGMRRGSFWKTVDDNGFVFCTAASAGLACAAANAALRDFPHYYLQVAPWLALLLGILVEGVVVRAEASAARRTIAHLVVLVPAVLVAAVMCHVKTKQYADDAGSRPTQPRICQYVRWHSNSDQSIYVWGFAADLYTFCERRPASRYVYSTFPSGYVPFDDGASPAQDDARAVPGSREILLSELQRESPALVLDIPNTMGNRSITRVPALAAFLRTYCPPIQYDGVNVWARRGPDGSCPDSN
jgi:hypothetical protein